MEKLAYRRIVKVGNSLYVSLPKRWVESRGIYAGSLVAIEQLEEGLLIKPAAIGDVGERKRVKRLKRATARSIIGAYLSGYDIIEVERPSSSLNDEEVAKLLNLLVGLEIVEDSVDRITFQCFVREYCDVKSVIHRMDVLSRSMYVDAARALESGDENTLRSVRSREERLDRLYFLAVRLIRSLVKSPSLSGDEKLFLIDARVAVKLLEEIGDEAERMTYAEACKGVYEAARKIAESQKAAIYSFLGDRRHGLKVEISSLPRVPSEGALRSLERIAGMVLDLAELV